MPFLVLARCLVVIQPPPTVTSLWTPPSAPRKIFHAQTDDSRQRRRPDSLLSEVDSRRTRARRPGHRSRRPEILRRRQDPEVATRSARRLHHPRRSSRRRERSKRRTRFSFSRNFRRRILRRFFRHRQDGRHQLESSPALSQRLEVRRTHLHRQPETSRRMEIRNALAHRIH